MSRSGGMSRITTTVATLAVSLVVGAASLLVAGGATTAGADTLAPANGQGSTYAALAFQQWTQDAQNNGLSVNYIATNSPAGLNAFAQSTADFAGTEAEYTSLNGGGNVPVPRGYEYTPDVGGATAIMYNVATSSDGSNPVNYLHLSRLTVAKIFLGVITNWDDPEITRDNAASGLHLPNKHIILNFRTGQSGTTALFYDFVKQTDPTDFANWAQKNGFSTGSRILEVDNGPSFSGPYAQGFSGSDQQAQAIANPSGLWSIGYDEFAYAQTYGDNVAWIQNASGNFVQPFAENIAAALQSAVLAPDTSQNLDGVYASTNPLAYPISAYSYILVQCAPSADRPTCATPYADPGIKNTLAQFMTYIACAGQIKMAQIGYSPLPPQLSQFMADAVGRVLGQPPVQLNAANCANPQFQGGNLGVGATPPPDPTAGGGSGGGGPGSTGPAGSGGSTPTGSGGSATGGARTASRGVGATGLGAGRSGAVGPSGVAEVGRLGGQVLAVGGGSTDVLSPDPVAFLGPLAGSGPPWPLLALVLALVLPVLRLTRRKRRRFFRLR